MRQGFGSGFLGGLGLAVLCALGLAFALPRVSVSVQGILAEESVAPVVEFMEPDLPKASEFMQGRPTPMSSDTSADIPASTAPSADVQEPN